MLASEVQLGSIHDTGSFNFFLYSDQNGQPENNFLAFAINATPAPEPEIFALAGLGLAISFFCEKK